MVIMKTAARYDFHTPRLAFFGPALPSISDIIRLARTGGGINTSRANYSEIDLICPYRGDAFVTLCWHPLYKGGLNVAMIGRDDVVIDTLTAYSMIRSHQRNARHQAYVRYQQHRARMWRERQESRPSALDLRNEGKRSKRTPHPAVWDTAAFPTYA